jgi:hypothetical protein
VAIVRHKRFKQAEICEQDHIVFAPGEALHTKVLKIITLGESDLPLLRIPDGSLSAGKNAGRDGCGSSETGQSSGESRSGLLSEKLAPWPTSHY